MSAKTSIQWTDRSWNPVTGCTKISAGCDNCYAETIAERFRGHSAFPHGFDVQLRPKTVNDPLRWRDPHLVFVNSMSDLFHDAVQREWIADIFAVMAAARRQTFQLLTKRHARMRSLLSDPAFAAEVWNRAVGKGLPTDAWEWPLPNLWVGVSVETQQWADIRIRALLDTPAAIRFISAEPLLGPITLSAAWTRGRYDKNRALTANDMLGIGLWPDIDAGLDWVIVGGESGRSARPMHPDWARSLRDQCAAAGVPLHFKQWGEFVTEDQSPEDATLPGFCRYLYGDPGPCFYRVGKKLAGRELDGRTWDEFPGGAS